MTTLITGGAGFLGTNLAQRLVELGEDVVLFDVTNSSLDGKKAKMVKGDLACFGEVFEVIKNNQIKNIFHCGALLSQSAEENVPKAFEVNLLGTWYLLEAARLFGVQKMMFISTNATFGSYLSASQPVPNTAPQYPNTIYGVSKVSSERLGEYYRHKYGIDFRGIRFPSVIGAGRGAGGLSSYTSLVIEKAALGEPYHIFVEPHCCMPLLYIKDAVRALLELFQARDDQLRYRIYNLNGFSPTAGEIVEEIKKEIPEAKLYFAPEPELVKIVDSWPNYLDDTAAQEDWHWRPEYDLKKTIQDFIDQARKNTNEI